MILTRAETPADYATIARIHTAAFEDKVAESVIVALARQRTDYDPELSIVAEFDEVVAGHALFSPTTVRLMGSDVRAVLVAPVAVDPALQRSGVGAALMQAGHTIAREKGYEISILLGFASYYPKFGYMTGMFGESSVIVEPSRLAGTERELKSRKVKMADVPALRDLWRHEEGGVNLSIMPGESLLDWVSPNPSVSARVFTDGETIVGYLRWQGDGVKMLLAQDHDVARTMVKHVGTSTVTLPLHPESASAGAFDEGPIIVHAWEAGMARVLHEGRFHDYVRALPRGRTEIGRPIWPVEFELE